MERVTAPARFRRALFVAASGLLLAFSPAEEPAYTRFQNRAKPKEFLHLENGRLESGPIKNNWKSADWILERADPPYFRIRNRARAAFYIHEQTGDIEAGPILDPGWHSAQWALQRTPDGYVRLRNRWRNEDYLHIENGAIQTGTIESRWQSAQWKLVAVDSTRD